MADDANWDAVPFAFTGEDYHMIAVNPVGLTTTYVSTTCEEPEVAVEFLNYGFTEEGRKLYEEIKGGYITKMSFGFAVEEDKREETYNTETGITTVLRTITKIKKLYDVSAVSLPANDATEISARNYCDGVIAGLEEERRKKLDEEYTVNLLKLYLEVNK